jgi:putative mRNA 3-end processing factor
MKPEALLHPTPAGLFCPIGRFHVDPVRPVERALVTHGHADHARPGNASVLATAQTLDIMGIRYGKDFCRERQVAAIGEVIAINGVRVSFHPAGHVLGSAQIAVEKDGLRIVVSGDYKRGPDPTCASFEPDPLRRLHHRGNIRAAGLPASGRPKGEIAKLLKSIRQFPERAHLDRRLCARQGAARHPAAARCRLRQDDLYPRRAEGALRLLRKPGDRARATGGPRRSMGKKGSISPGPSSSDRPQHSPIAGRAVSTTRSPACLRLDAGAPARQAARGRTADLVLSDHCRLARAGRDDPGPSAFGGLGDARPRGGAGALVRVAGIRARPLHLVGYEDEGD